MTELLFILVLSALGLAAAAFLARRSPEARAPVPLRRAMGTLERSMVSALAQQLKPWLLATVTAAGLGAALGATRGFSAAFWLFSAVVGGALTTGLLIWWGALMGMRGVGATLGGQSQALGVALTGPLRAAGAIAVAVEATALLLPTTLFAVVYGMKGGLSLRGNAALLLAQETLWLIVPCAAGAVLLALIAQRVGGTYSVGAVLGCRLAADTPASTEPSVARHPAAMTELVGRQLGQVVALTADSFAVALLINVTLGLVGLSLLLEQPTVSVAVAVAPIVARSFGGVVAALGVLVTRLGEGEPPSNALLRGLLSSSVVGLSAIGAVAVWLHGSGSALRLGVAAALGWLAFVLSALLTRTHRRGRAGARRAATRATGLDGGLALGMKLSLSFSQGTVTLVGLSAALGLGAWLGAGLASAHGPILGLLATLTGALGGYGIALTVATLGPLLETARGLAQLSSGAPSTEQQRRGLLLQELGVTSGAAARTFLLLGGGGAAALAVAALRLGTPLPTPLPSSASLATAHQGEVTTLAAPPPAPVYLEAPTPGSTPVGAGSAEPGPSASASPPGPAQATLDGPAGTSDVEASAAPSLTMPPRVLSLEPTLGLSALLIGGLLGAAWVLGAVGLSMRAAGNAAHALGTELQRQLASLPREGTTPGSTERGASQRAYLELMLAHSMRGLWRPIALVLGFPVVLHSASRLTPQLSSALGPLLVAALASVAALVALTLALSLDGTTAWPQRGRSSDMPKSSPLLDLTPWFGGVGAPAAHLFAHALIVMLLCLQPFLP